MVVAQSWPARWAGLAPIGRCRGASGAGDNSTSRAPEGARCVGLAARAFCGCEPRARPGMILTCGRRQLLLCDYLLSVACAPWSSARRGWVRFAARLIGMWSTYNMGCGSSEGRLHEEMVGRLRGLAARPWSRLREGALTRPEGYSTLWAHSRVDTVLPVGYATGGERDRGWEPSVGKQSEESTMGKWALAAGEARDAAAGGAYEAAAGARRVVKGTATKASIVARLGS